MKSVALISLGCDKNRIDSERIMYNLFERGYELISDSDESLSVADIIIVNTCAFIESARIEAIDTILSASQYKNQRLEKLIVAGCLPQKYAGDLAKDLPEVDAFVGIDSYEKIGEIIDDLYAEKYAPCAYCEPNEDAYAEKRILSTPMHYAYLKIADGCDNHCTFCTIPSIRGRYRSRSKESLVSEVNSLVNNGVSEVILVAQDVTKYGIDNYGTLSIVPLIRLLGAIEGVTTLRLMYCYPELVTDELINEIVSNKKVAKYIDIPLQHTSDEILKKMNRRSRHDDIVKLVGRIRLASPEIAIRTTLMVGFPSETDEQFDEMCDFVREQKLDNVGIFAYSAEEGTPSYKMAGKVPSKVKLARVKTLGKIHEQNAIERNKSMIGKVVAVTYEDIDYDRNMFVGRRETSAPLIDSVVYFTADFVDIGCSYDIEITGYDGYDLIGKKV